MPNEFTKPGPRRLFGFALFRSRSLERDRETDASRRKAVQEVVDRQRSAAFFELEGLSKRMEQAYASASALLDASEFQNRSPEDEVEIRKFEASAGSARARIAVLKEEIGIFDAIILTLRS